jgi:predicted alpha/beta-fold hydrolase
MDKNSWLILLLKQFWIFWLVLLLTIFRIIPFYYPILAYLLFCVYHQLTSTTEIIYTPNSPMEEIIKKSNLESFKFRPCFFLPITPLQFINLFRTKVKPKNKISVERKYIGNNGVCLDWIKYEGINNENNPILIIFPGLTGCVDDAYVINIANECIVNGGFNTCIYQMRLLTEKLKVDKHYLFLMDDIDETLDELRKEYGENKNIYGIGFSYGANQMVKYLGQKNYIKKKINAAVSISNPYEFIISSRLGLNKLYNRMLLSFLQKVVVKTRNNLEKLNLDVDFLLNTNQMKDFDDFYTAKIFGFSCADEYYRNVSSVNEMGNITFALH